MKLFKTSTFAVLGSGGGHMCLGCCGGLFVSIAKSI